ncbi:hypothetical protein D3C87_1720420 [compost metagenome]
MHSQCLAWREQIEIPHLSGGAEARRQNNYSRFAKGASGHKTDTGHDSRHSYRQHHLADDMELGHPEGIAGFTDLSGNGAHRFFRDPGQHRQVKQRQADSPPREWSVPH